MLLQEYDSARVMLERVVERSGRSGLAVSGLAYALAASGDQAGARALLAEVEERGRTEYVPAFEVARVHAALGDRDAALRWLERAAEERAHSIAFLTVDPAFAGLRSDSRFEALVRLRRP